MSSLELSNGEKIYYEETGKGENTIVMLHGWSSSHLVFEQVVPEIGKKARCITYDQRGHGYSKNANKEQVTMDTLASDLNELICNLGLHDITLLGWSMGAGVIMDYIYLYGCHSVNKVVLCDMTPKQLNDDEWHLGLYKGHYTKADMDKDERKRFYNLYKEFAIAAMPKLDEIPRFFLRRLLKSRLADCDVGVLKSLSKSMKTKDFRECIKKIEVPLYYLYAVPGNLYSTGLAGWYDENVTGPYEAVAFGGCSHMLIYDNPEKFVKEVMRIIEERKF